MDELKTSDEWYKDDKTCDILDPDGWNRSKTNNIDWFQEKITLKQYKKRLNNCTISEYGYRNHECPFKN